MHCNKPFKLPQHIIKSTIFDRLVNHKDLLNKIHRGFVIFECRDICFIFSIELKILSIEFGTSSAEVIIETRPNLNRGIFDSSLLCFESFK